jgi:lauroyl/myristoyl acyltransferase
MLTVACRRTDEDRFETRGLPLIHCASTEPAEIHRASQAVADALTAVIAEDPGQWYMFRPVWPQTDADRARAAEALAAARRGEDWTKIAA